MNYSAPLIPGTILRRYKRFLADVELASGEVITAHTPNTGSMKTCWAPGWPVLLSKSDNPHRKLAYTLELTHNGVSWIGVNTARTNAIVECSLQQGLIPELRGYSTIQREVTVGGSRLDFKLTGAQGPDCFVEVKNVTYAQDGEAQFPDAVSERGQKHLLELMELKEAGYRSVLFLLVAREDATTFSPAYEMDPAYSFYLTMAYHSGVEILPYRAQLTPQGITPVERLKLETEGCERELY